LRTQEAIHELGWTTLPHPACSPDLAPSDYHLFGKLKEFLRGNHYGNVDDVKRGVQTWIKQTPVAFFEKSIMDLVPRWQSALLVTETMLKNNSQSIDAFY
jgi:[histone H3]-lysine36 N-dimethyltransferase SETMAR